MKENKSVRERVGAGNDSILNGVRLLSSPLLMTRIPCGICYINNTVKPYILNYNTENIDIRCQCCIEIRLNDLFTYLTKILKV